MFQFLKRHAKVEKPIVVQIGFNKCATKSLTILFAKSGYNALHYNFRFFRGTRKKASERPAQEKIFQNIKAGRPAFTGFEDIDAFFDLEFHRPNMRRENFKSFREIHEFYPNAKFILNMREKEAWLNSRRRHQDGKYLAKFMSIYDETEDQIIQRWAEDYDSHHAQVREFFRPYPGKLLEFQIETDDVSKVIEFVKPDFKLNPEKWGHYHKSKNPAEAES